MTNDDKNKRKGIIYLTIAVVTLLVLVVGATYAYFQAQMGNGESFDINATAGTTDLLTFSMIDINTSTSKPNVTDNHNKAGDVENTEIKINATQDNFGEKGTSLGDGIKATAKLTANNTTKTATQYYNVFFVMDQNDLIYTQDTDHPELILTVIGPDTEEVKTITGLNYHEADPSNPNDVSGFDITGRTDSFAIKTNQEIKVEESTPELTTTQEWQIKVTLVNLTTDQKENTNKTITGDVVITKETMDTYKLAHVNKVNEIRKTADSVTTSLDYDKGTKEIKEYYFGIEEIGPVSTIATIDGIEYNKSEDNEYTFTKLKDNTNYKIYGYVVDEEGFSSNIYKGETTIVTEKAPTINSVKVTTKSYNEINIEVEASKGTNDIVGYEYSISGASIPEPLIVEESNTNYKVSHKFSNLSAGQPYEINVRAKDSKGSYSLPYTLNKNTASIYNYEYTDNRLATGESYAFIAPSNGTYKIELWGAQGGNASGEYFGGKGAYTTGKIDLQKGENLYVYVGQQGASDFAFFADSITDPYSKYTWNVSYYRSSITFNNGTYSHRMNGSSFVGTGAAGGGATDIRLDNGIWDTFESLKTRIMVASAGSGVHAINGVNFNGIDGGTLNGYEGNKRGADGKIATGGTQTSGGLKGGGMHSTLATDGSFGKGGQTMYMAGSGGSGYYGGGSGPHGNGTAGAGGSGSSFISGYKGCVAIKQESTESNIQPKDNCTDGTENVACSYHYSGKIFIEPNMIAGNAEMPNHEGTGVMVGNEGNGYAKITPISIADE